jgi:hypothetical protein
VSCYTYLDVKKLCLLHVQMFDLVNMCLHRVLRAKTVKVMAIRYCGQIREVLKKGYT